MLKHAKAAKKPAAATADKVSGKKAAKGAAAKTVAAAGDDAPRASVKRTETSLNSEPGLMTKDRSCADHPTAARTAVRTSRSVF